MLLHILSMWFPEVPNHSAPPSGASVLTQAEPMWALLRFLDLGPKRVICIYLWWWRARDQHQEWPLKWPGATRAVKQWQGPRERPSGPSDLRFQRLWQPDDKLHRPREPLLQLPCCSPVALLSPMSKDSDQYKGSSGTGPAEEQICAHDAAPDWEWGVALLWADCEWLSQCSTGVLLAKFKLMREDAIRN